MPDNLTTAFWIVCGVAGACAWVVLMLACIVPVEGKESADGK